MLAVAVMMELALGNNPLAARKKKDGITLGDLFKEYLHGYAIDHCKTWKVIEECFYRYLDRWKTRPVSSIKRSDVQMLVNKLGKENGRATANRTVELLRAVINKGKQWELVDCDNPATGITKFKLKQSAALCNAESQVPAAPGVSSSHAANKVHSIALRTEPRLSDENPRKRAMIAPVSSDRVSNCRFASASNSSSKVPQAENN